MERCAVILCTRNRPREVLALVEQLSRQTLPPSEVLVVDSSDADELAAHLVLNGPTCRYIHTEPGLTHQRNVGLKALLPCDYVLFVDDDVSVPDSFVEVVARTFRANPDLVGVGARTTDNPVAGPRRLDRLMMLDSRHSGRLLKSGVNVPFRDRSGPYLVDWLPGCAMAYRYSAMRGMEFDESRHGVGWGEDVDFSARMAVRGKLMILTEPSVVHAQSPIGRDSAAVRRVCERVSRARLAADAVGRVHPFAVLYGSMFLAGRDDLIRGYFAFGALRHQVKRSLGEALVATRATVAEAVRADASVDGQQSDRPTVDRMVDVATRAGRVSTHIAAGRSLPNFVQLSRFYWALTRSTVSALSEPVRYGQGFVVASCRDLPLTYRELKAARRRSRRPRP